MKWITTRRPTKPEAGRYEEVLVKAYPDEENWVPMHYSLVPAGMAWRQVSASTAPAPEPEPIPPAEHWPLPRLFAAPIRRTFFPSGEMVIDAIADDGTAWFLVEGEAPAPHWKQIPPLPQPEAE
jgi:hypothetical protein